MRMWRVLGVLAGSLFFSMTGCVGEDEPSCGDGILEGAEQCDDGNLDDGDGCSASCTVEPPAICGNGVLEAGEPCDDGNLEDGDGCEASCLRTPTTLARLSYPPRGLVVSASHVFWLGPEHVMRLPLDGGEPRRLAATPQAEHMTRSRTHLYWVARPDPHGAAQVLRVPIKGGEPIVLATGRYQLGHIALDSTHVYWTGRWGEIGTVYRMAQDGGEPVRMAHTVSPGAIAVSGKLVYWSCQLSRTDPTGQIRRIPITGGPSRTVALGEAPPTAIVTNDTHLYWTDAAAGLVMRARLSGNAPAVLASGQKKPTAIAVDSTHVYWTNESGGEVLRVPLAGGTPTRLASGQRQPSAIAVDDTHVYWLSRGGQRVMKLALE